MNTVSYIIILLAFARLHPNKKNKDNCFLSSSAKTNKQYNTKNAKVTLASSGLVFLIQPKTIPGPMESLPKMGN